MALQWVSVELRTGLVLAEFPDLNAGTVSRTIAQYDSTTVNFPVAGDPAPPGNWLAATTRYSTMMVGLDPIDGEPAWGGIVQQRKRPGGGQVQLTVATPEIYATRRFIRATLQYPNTDRLVIAEDLLTRYVIDGAGGRNGLPLRVVRTGSGQLVDGDYKDTDDKSVYSVFQDLGLEWTIGLEWQSDPSRITMVCYLSEQLGMAASPGPAVTLDWPGNLASVTITEDYADGQGANDVMATSTGQGDVRPQSDHQVNVAPDMPTVEQRYSAGSNITSRATLNADAATELAIVEDGSTSYEIAVSQIDPIAWQLGLGDDVGIDVSGPEFPDHPQSVQRIVSLQFDASTVQPVLAGGGGDD